METAGFPEVPDLHSVVVRTYFADEVAWAHLQELSIRLVGDFRALLVFVSDRRLEGANAAQIIQLLPQDQRFFPLFIADYHSMSGPEGCLLVVNTRNQALPSFRVPARELWSVQNNLCLANMDFEEFESAIDAGGTFRGFG